jgi:hypothetical protein
MTHALKSLMSGENGKDRIEYALLKYIGAQPHRSAAGKSAEPVEGQTVTEEGAATATALEQHAETPVIAANTATAADAAAPIAAVAVAAPEAVPQNNAQPVPAQSLDEGVRQILEQAEKLCSEGRYSEASALIDKAEAISAAAAGKGAPAAAIAAAAAQEPAPESPNVQPNVPELDASVRALHLVSEAEVAREVEIPVPEIIEAPAPVAKAAAAATPVVAMAAAASEPPAVVAPVIEAPLVAAAAAASPVAATPESAAVVHAVVSAPAIEAPAVARAAGSPVATSMESAPAVHAPVIQFPVAHAPELAFAHSHAAEPPAAEDEEDASDALGFEETVAAKIAGDIAKGLANVLVGALQHLERHVTGEGRRLTSALSQRLDRLQASVESLQPLSGRIEDLVQAGAAVQEKYEQLAATTASLQKADAQRAADIGALRAQVQELSSSSVARVDQICRRMEGQARDIASANSTFSELTSKFAAAAQRLERHADAIRSLHNEHTQRSAALDQIADALARLRPANGQPLSL